MDKNKVLSLTIVASSTAMIFWQRFGRRDMTGFCCDRRGRLSGMSKILHAIGLQPFLEIRVFFEVPPPPDVPPSRPSEELLKVRFSLIDV